MNAADLTIWLVVGAGILSFISPCSLPLYPSYLSYITGVSIQDLKENRGIMQKSAIIHTVIFYDRFLGYILCVRFIGELDWDYFFI